MSDVGDVSDTGEAEEAEMTLEQVAQAVLPWVVEGMQSQMSGLADIIDRRILEVVEHEREGLYTQVTQLRAEMASLNTIMQKMLDELYIMSTRVDELETRANVALLEDREEPPQETPPTKGKITPPTKGVIG